MCSTEARAVEAWNTRSDASQAHLAEAVKVLEVFAQLADWPLNGLAESEPVNCRVYGKDRDHVIAGFGLRVGEFLAAKAFIATLGEKGK